MGQKVNPTGFRLGSTFGWRSRWFASKDDYSNKVIEDFELRKFFEKKLSSAGLVDVVIERSLKKIKICWNLPNGANGPIASPRSAAAKMARWSMSRSISRQFEMPLAN